MVARRQWKMAMGIATAGEGDGPALSDSDDSGAPAANEDSSSEADDIPAQSNSFAGKKARKMVGFGFSTPAFFDCTQTLRPGRKTWEQVGRVSEEALKMSLNNLPAQLQVERDLLLAKHEEMFPWWHCMGWAPSIAFSTACLTL
jgi:hypothetical protein